MSFRDAIGAVSLKARNFKCFSDEPQGFDTFRPTNVIVGRNNSGKSTLLDMVELACEYRGIDQARTYKSNIPHILISKPLVESELRQIFPTNTSGGEIGGNHWEFGRQFIGDRIEFALQASNKQLFVDLSTNKNYDRAKKHFHQLAERVENIFRGKQFRRLTAERDISSEPDNGSMGLAKNGVGFTNIVQRFLNKSSLPSELIEITLLNALNKIFSPDASFSAIRVQHHENNEWEIYLEEEAKGRIPLSHSGSGLKTVLLVLGFVFLLPHIEGKPLSEFIFAFEELENNLHPALQRRLIGYIHEVAIERNVLVLLTTHSSAIIDRLSRDEAAQIIHVTHSGEVARARRVSTYVDNRGVLDDLDVRASDLLQANGIVWVEGPSDRLYFNRWVALATNNVLQEGVHYQCVPYGGRLLAHLTAVQPFDRSDVEEAIQILRVNRNAIILIDSDKKLRNTPLNNTKKRIVEEFSKFGGMAWVTKGREIENYIPQTALRRMYPELLKQLAEYEDISEFLEKHRAGEGRRFVRNKVLFAEQIVAHIELGDLGTCLDLSEKVLAASKQIANWNGIQLK